MRAALAIEKCRGGLRFAGVARFHLVVERLHRGFGDGPFQMPHGRHERRVTRRRLQPVEPHRVVTWKKIQVVLEQHQIAAADHGIGRIDVDEVDLARQQLAIRDIVVHAGDARLLQIVTAF